MELLKRGLKLTHLRIVAALSETGQIGLAAARLGITQPAASRLLAEVDALTGHPVHQRTGRGVTLTPEGTALARRAARVLAEISDAGREIDELAGGATGHVRIGSVTGPALDRVLPALRAARLSLPGITAEVEVATSDVLGDQLLSGRLDFTLARLPQGADPALFDISLIGSEPVSLVVRAGHRLAGKADLQPADLMEFDWVLPGPGAILRQTVLARLAELGLPAPPGRLATSSFLLTLAMLQQSNAIAPLARAVATRFASGDAAPYAVLALDLAITVAPYGIVTRRAATLTPAASRIRTLILQTRP
ncbi:MAG: LysR substrate-binding domain-containing protein [Rhodobacterales bacterium]|nr:LysR substrate-binding domain-containing protein [Rhodobacterales bacterium]